MMYEHANLSGSSMSRQDPVPEPVPEWSLAWESWHWGWYIHTYGFGSIFFLLGLYAIVSVFEFRRRLKVQQYLLAINITLLVLGISRATYLFVDPYESVGQIPTVISRILYGIAFPCLTSSFSLIQMVFMRITRVTMGPSKLQNYRVLAAIITSHFTIVIVIDITVAYKNNLKLLLLLCQCIFITYGLVLCFGFVYGGFKMSQFTNETKRVLKQLAVYQKVKQETLKNGNRRDLALHRISKPKIRIIDDDNRTLSFGSDSDLAEESSDSLSFYNDAHLALEDEEIAKAFIANLDRGYRKHKADPKERNCATNLHLNRSESNMDLSSESDYVTDTPSTAGPIMDDFPTRMTHNSNRQGMDMLDDLNSVPKSGCSSATNIFTVENEMNAFINPALDLKHESPAKNKAVSNGFVSQVEFQPLCQDSCDHVLTATTNADDQPQESGYWADTELNSPKRCRKKGKSRRKGRIEEEEEEKEERDNNSPQHEPYPLPLAEGTVSLYRIRQGRVLHKTLKISYFTTLLGFICCVLELYAMFGVYGVLSTEEYAEPWPWFIFHTFFR